MALKNLLALKEFDTKINIPELKKKQETMSGQDFNLVFKNSDLDYGDFLEEYAHENCTVLAYWLYDNYDLKLGAIRAIDQNDEDDTDYETVVHQYVSLPNGLVLDARGIGTEKEMLMYYRDASVFDDEDWDFMVDDEYKAAKPKNGKRDFSEFEDTFNKFMTLLSDCVEIALRLENKNDNMLKLSANRPSYVDANLKETGFAFDGLSTFYSYAEHNVKLASSVLLGEGVSPENGEEIKSVRKGVIVGISPELDFLIAHDTTGKIKDWGEFVNLPFESIEPQRSKSDNLLCCASEENLLLLGGEVEQKKPTQPVEKNPNTQVKSTQEGPFSTSRKI